MKNSNSSQATCLIILSIIATLLAPFSMQAESAIWSGSTSDLWSLPDNWVGSPAVPGVGDTATFDSAGGSTLISLGSGVTINNIFFNTANAAAYIIGSGARDSQTLLPRRITALIWTTTVLHLFMMAPRCSVSGQPASRC